MSTLINFYTYEVMRDAIINNASSEAIGHPAEHAISPLETSFAWETNEVDTQHTITIDLGETRSCDGFSFIDHESIDIDITVEYSSDAINWTTVPTVVNSDGSSVPTDLGDDDIQIKLRHFHLVGVLTDYKGRYWRFTLIGDSEPSPYYPESDTRLSMLWLFELCQLDRGASFPINDTPTYPASAIQLPFGKVYRTGHSINPYTPFTRTWMVTESEYDILRELMRKCNGTYRPFLFVDSDGIRRLCKFETDEITEELLDVGLYRITFSFIELPIIRKDKRH